MYYFDFLEELYKQDIKYLIVGGLAVNLYGVPRITQDIDIIVSTDEENLIKILQILENLNYKPQLPIKAEEILNSEKIKFWIENKNLKAFSFYNFDDNSKIIDILLAHNLDFNSAYQRKKTLKIKDFLINLVSIDDLIELKRFAGRLQDFSDVEMLEKVKQIERENES
ncbi:MAG: nucleotidyltransferase family protein [Candidatus Kapabacteria bacterium]|nr:nucleotidyltransferase family protein [Candidatus Kapabacteria bacterium]